MKITQLAIPLLATVLAVTGCATNIDNSMLLKRAAFALNTDESNLTIKETSQEGVRTNFVAALANGKTYRCYVTGTPGWQKVASFGTFDTSDAICSGVNNSGESSSKPSCNALLKAAGRC